MSRRSCGAGRREVSLNLCLATSGIVFPSFRQLDEEALLQVLEERGLVDQVMGSLDLSVSKKSQKVKERQSPKPRPLKTHPPLPVAVDSE